MTQENKDKRKKLFRVLYIIGTIGIIALIGILDPNIEDLLGALKRINLNFILLGFLSLFLFWISDGILLHHITSYVYGRTSLIKSIKVGLIGLYYGALTPFATGGQPMQVVYMKRDGIPYGVSMCIVTVKFIVYEISLCLFYVVAMFFRGGYFYNGYRQVFWFTTLGFIINLASVVLVLAVMLNKQFPHRIGYWFVRVLNKIKIIKKPEKAYKSIDKSISDFHDGVEYIVRYKCKVMVSVIISVLNLFFLFAIPYFIYLAFGHTEKSIIDLVTMQSFLSLAVSFFPLPGASGASEGGFYIFFSSYFTNVPVFIPMIIWRFISYYTVLITGAVLVVADELFSMRKCKKNTP